MDLTPTFNAAAGGPTGEPASSEGQGPQDSGGGGASATVEANALSEAAAPAETEPVAPPPLSLEDAEAELEALEAGRPKPALRDDFNPPAKLRQIVHTEVERQRELRVSALEAYLEFSQSDPENTRDHDFSNDPEPTL